VTVVEENFRLQFSINLGELIFKDLSCYIVILNFELLLDFLFSFDEGLLDFFFGVFVFNHVVVFAWFCKKGQTVDDVPLRLVWR